jgi:hypothetical protein
LQEVGLPKSVDVPFVLFDFDVGHLPTLAEHATGRGYALPPDSVHLLRIGDAGYAVCLDEERDGVVRSVSLIQHGAGYFINTLVERFAECLALFQGEFIQADWGNALRQYLEALDRVRLRLTTVDPVAFSDERYYWPGVFRGVRRDAIDEIGA